MPGEASWKKLKRAFQGSPPEPGWVLELFRALQQRDPPEGVAFAAALAEAIAASGTVKPKEMREKWKEKDCIAVDIPSTGGTGSKVPLVVPPIVVAAACAAARQNEFKKPIIPKMSTRGSTAGTIDILESIGYNAKLSLDQYVRIVRKIGLSDIAPTPELAPLDEWLMELRRKTATMRQAHLTVASILGKKLAVGCTKLVIEIKDGAESKMRFARSEDPPSGLRPDEWDAIRGAELFINVGERLGIEVVCVITDGSRPQGRFLGNRLALVEVMGALSGKLQDKKLKTLYHQLACEVLELAGREGWEEKVEKVCRPSNQGDSEAFRRFHDMLIEHGVRPDAINALKNALKEDRLEGMSLYSEEVKALRGGYVQAIDVALIDEALKRLIRSGSGQQKSYNTGIELKRQVGKHVQQGEVLAVIHGNEEWQRETLRQMVQHAFRIGDVCPASSSYLKFKVKKKNGRCEVYWRAKDGWEIRNIG